MTTAPAGRRLSVSMPKINLIEAVVALLIAFTLTRETFIAPLFDWANGKVLQLLIDTGALQGIDFLGLQGLFYLFGAILLIGLILFISVCQYTLRLWSTNVYLAILSVQVFSGLYLLDFFLSTKEPYPFDLVYWAFWSACLFLLTLLIQKRENLVRLIWLICLAIGFQACYAIAYHYLDVNQFQTPHFGGRTGGTLGSPNQLYPVMMIGVILSISLALRALNRLEAGVGWLIAVLCLMSLIFTYTRIGWIAVSVTLLFFVFSKFTSKPVKWILLITSIGLFLGAGLIRTQGAFMGNESDRSFWGRTAIWDAASSAVRQQPWIGYGTNTYEDLQKSHMTERLKSFNPMNNEPKNLFLHLLTEFGVVGLAIFLSLLLFTLRLALFQSDKSELSQEHQCLRLGALLAILTLLLAGAADTPFLHFSRLEATFLAFTLLGIVVAISNPDRVARPPEEIKARERRLLRGAAALSLLGVIALIAAWIPISHTLHRARSNISQGMQAIQSREGYTPISQLPQQLTQAMVASEDRLFYEHSGVDWQALHRSLRYNVRSRKFAQGGSTITMQTARYVWLGRERTLFRKVSEILFALELEKQLTKEQILELYFNSAKFGLGAYNIGSASLYYFAKKPAELSFGEIMFLSGVLPEPPASPADLTPELVHRCQQRAYQRWRANSGFLVSSETDSDLNITFAFGGQSR